MSSTSEEKVAHGDSMLIEKLKKELETKKKEASKLKELNGILIKKSKEKEQKLVQEKDQCLNKIGDLTLKLGDFGQVLNYQNELADELVQREPEKTKKLKRQKKELVVKCEETEKQLNEVKVKFEESKAAFDDKQAENNEIKQAMLAMKSENIKANEEIEQLKARVDQKNKELSLRDAEIVQLQDQKQNDQRSIAQQAKVISELEAKIKEMDVDAAKKDLRILELEQKMKDANTQAVDQLAKLSVEKALEQAGAKVQISNLENENASLKREVECMKHEIKSLQFLYTELQCNAEESAAVAESKIGEIAAELQATVKRARDSESKANQVEQVIAKVNAAFAEAQEHIAASEKERETVLERLRKKDQALEWQLQINNQMKQDIDKRNEIIESLVKKVNDFVKLLIGEPGASEGIVQKMDHIKEKMNSIQDKVFQIEAKGQLKKSFRRRVLQRLRRVK